MALPVVFATLAGGNQPLSLLDTQFSAVAALGSIPCAAAGQNTIALTPFSNTPTVSSYPDLAPSFVFAAAQTSTGAVTINAALAGARNAYKWNGSLQCGAGDIIAGNVYRATPLAALNSGSGGFVVDAIGALNNRADIEFVIDGGGVAITTGVKGYLRVPWVANIAFWVLMADQAGSIVVDVFRANNSVPSVSMIGGGNKPTLSASQYSGAITPGGWTSTLFAINDWIGFNVVSAITVTRATLSLILDKL
jgi:hypothetical protein